MPAYKGPNAQGKRHRSTEGAEGTNTGHENAEGMACVGVRLTAQLGGGVRLIAWMAGFVESLQVADEFVECGREAGR